MNDLNNEIYRMQQGDFSGYENFYSQTVKLIYNLIYDVVQDNNVASAILDDTYNQIYKEIGQLYNVDDFYIWSFKIATTKIADYYKLFNMLVHIPEIDDTMLPIEFLVDDNEEFVPENILVDTEYLRIVGQELNNLPKEHKIVLQFFYIEKLSVSEIANRMGITKGAVRYLIFQIRDHLKKIVGTYASNSNVRMQSVYAIPVIWYTFWRKMEELTGISMSQMTSGIGTSTGNIMLGDGVGAGQAEVGANYQGIGTTANIEGYSTLGSDTSIPASAASGSAVNTVAISASSNITNTTVGTSTTTSAVATSGLGLGMKIAISIVVSIAVGVCVATVNHFINDKNDEKKDNNTTEISNDIEVTDDPTEIAEEQTTESNSFTEDKTTTEVTENDYTEEASTENTTEITTEVTTEEIAIDKYKDKYLEVLRNKELPIYRCIQPNNYNKKGQVTLLDITGDNIPELFYMYSEAYFDDYRLNVDIYTYENEEAKKIYTKEVSNEIGGGKFFCIFSSGGQIYHASYQKGYASLIEYYKLEYVNGNVSEELIFKHSYMPNEGDNHTEDGLDHTYYAYGEQISEGKFNEGYYELWSGLDDVILYNGFTSELEQYDKLQNITALSWEEGYEALAGEKPFLNTVLPIGEANFMNNIDSFNDLLVLNPDGSFVGASAENDDILSQEESHDDIYVHIKRISDCSGHFGDIEKIDEGIYYMKIEDLADNPGEPWKEYLDEEGKSYREYIPVKNEFFDRNADYYLYLEGTPLEKLPQVIVNLLVERGEDRLNCNYLYNEDMGVVFNTDYLMY